MILIENLSIIIPTKNDHLRIKENIWQIDNFLKKNINNYEIIIVSNGSTKESTDFIKSLEQEYKYVKQLIFNESGKGSAIKEGLLISKYDNALFIDADSSVAIEEFVNFVEGGRLKSAYTIGNRRNEKSKNLKSPLSRKTSGFIYARLLQVFFKLNIEDTQCGFKAINKNSFKNFHNFHTKGYSFDLELLIIAKIDGVKVTEIPVKYVHNNDTKVSLFSDTITMLRETYLLYSKYKTYIL